MKDEKIKKVFNHAVDTLKNNFHHMGKGRPDIQRDIKQRLDEIGLIYSDLFDISFNKAKKELKIEVPK